jgi:hypothetical protein
MVKPPLPSPPSPPEAEETAGSTSAGRRRRRPHVIQEEVAATANRGRRAPRARIEEVVGRTSMPPDPGRPAQAAAVEERLVWSSSTAAGCPASLTMLTRRPLLLEILGIQDEAVEIRGRKSSAAGPRCGVPSGRSSDASFDSPSTAPVRVVGCLVVVDSRPPVVYRLSVHCFSHRPPRPFAPPTPRGRGRGRGRAEALLKVSRRRRPSE